MLSFRQYIAEQVTATKRVGLDHLENMKPAEFVKWLKSVKSLANGVISNYKTVSKVDGLNGKLGKDKDGRPFFEGARTGPIFDSGSFSAYALAKGSSEEVVIRSRHYDDMLELIKSAPFMKALPNDSKINAEIFYNPMASEDDTGITFVTVKYDKAKLGSLMSILPYTVLVASTGEEHPDKEEILSALYKASTDKIKIIDPNLKMHSIDISGVIAPIDVIDENGLEVLNSRKGADKEAKQNMLTIINKVKRELSQYLLEHPGIDGKWKLGPEIEGIVVHIPDKGAYKITTDKFRASKSKS